jgi:predicted RNase H-like HicB family nuclease
LLSAAAPPQAEHQNRLRRVLEAHRSGGSVTMNKRLTAIIQREDDGFVALCPELDVASQGDSIEAARENLREALQLFFECAPPAEIQQRLGDEVFVTQVEVSIG